MDFNRLSHNVKMMCLAVAAAAALAGCGNNLREQTAKDRLEQAHAAYAQAKSNPLVESYALKSLLDAEKVLQQADQAKTEAYSPYGSGDQNRMFDEISRLAYMAERKSQTTVAL